MSNWKKLPKYQGVHTWVNADNVVAIGHCEDTVRIRPNNGGEGIEIDFPTEQEAREFIEEFVGVSANGKLSDSKSDNQGSSPCAPECKHLETISDGIIDTCRQCGQTFPRERR